MCIQLPEPCDDDSEPGRLGFKNIAEIGKERIRRSAEKLKNATADGGAASGDFGFKVLKLDRSHFRQWGAGALDPTEPDLVAQMEEHADHVDPEATQEGILYELLIKAGFAPTDRVDRRELADKLVFSIADGALLICLEDELTSELIDAVADLEPMQFICLDKGFNGNDQLKANAVQTFKSRSQGAETEMVFKVI